MIALRLYSPDDVAADGYPPEWHRGADIPLVGGNAYAYPTASPGVKHLVRAQAGHRCVRCGHPYLVGQTDPEWSPCDEQCTHKEPRRVRSTAFSLGIVPVLEKTAGELVRDRYRVEAQWRVLTVHHLNTVKYDCRWFNLVALCQRDHLEIQSRVVMDRPWPWDHSAWFKPYVAGFYAWKYLGEELDREETMERLDELLERGKAAESVERMPI